LKDGMSMRMTLRSTTRGAGGSRDTGCAINSLAVNRRRGDSAANNFRPKM
jgi:hypothetical protein